MAKEIVGVFYESRKRLIKHGLILPAKSILSLDKCDPRRVAYESKLILSGIDPDTRHETTSVKIIASRSNDPTA
jgi:hypothetical protein